MARYEVLVNQLERERNQLERENRELEREKKELLTAANYPAAIRKPSSV